MREIVIEVRGGTVTEVYCDIANARTIIVDWDLIAQGDGQGQAGYLHEHSKLADLHLKAAEELRRVTSELEEM